MTANAIRMVTHADDSSIPEGKAMLYMDNNGWIGTNNGWPLAGQPALFPKSQAHAISLAWMGMTLNGGSKIMPHAEDVNPEVLKWMDEPRGFAHTQ